MVKKYLRQQVHAQREALPLGGSSGSCATGLGGDAEQVQADGPDAFEEKLSHENVAT